MQNSSQTWNLQNKLKILGETWEYFAFCYLLLLVIYSLKPLRFNSLEFY